MVTESGGISRRAFLALSGSIAAARAQTGKRPNGLLILADDLGFSDLGCYGGEIDTPNLNRLASDGERWTQFYTTARCCPSRAAILTGQYPHRVGVGHMVTDLGQPGYRGRLAENAATLAEVLQPTGYRTYISGKWHVGTPDPRLREGRVLRDRCAHGLRAGLLDDARQTPDRPWFLYLAYNSPHFPLQARRDEIAKYRDRYAVGWDALREGRLARMKKLGVAPASTRLSLRSPFTNFGETRKEENPAWDSLPAERRAGSIANRAERIGDRGRAR